MPCGGLRQLDILGLVVKVGQNGGAEAQGRYILRESRVLLDTVAHSSDLGS